MQRKKVSKFSTNIETSEAAQQGSVEQAWSHTSIEKLETVAWKIRSYRNGTETMQAPVRRGPETTMPPAPATSTMFLKAEEKCSKKRQTQKRTTARQGSKPTKFRPSFNFALTNARSLINKLHAANVSELDLKCFFLITETCFTDKRDDKKVYSTFLLKTGGTTQRGAGLQPRIRAFSRIDYFPT